MGFHVKATDKLGQGFDAMNLPKGNNDQPELYRKELGKGHDPRYRQRFRQSNDLPAREMSLQGFPYLQIKFCSARMVHGILDYLVNAARVV